MKITYKKLKFFLTIALIGIIIGCAGSSSRIAPEYGLISPYPVDSVTEGPRGPLVGFMSPGKGIVQEFDIKDWRLKIYRTQETPPRGTLIEDRGQLFGLVAGSGVRVALKGKEIYALIFSSDCQFKLPQEDIKDDSSIILHNDEYFVKGYKVKMISSHLGVIPTLGVKYFERIK